MELRGEGKICSFCGEPWGPEPHRRFAGGLGAQICATCIRRYADILGSEEGYRRANRPAWEEMSDEELLETLPRILATSDQVDAFLRDWVDLLRERGISWQHIGLALGISRQAAWERFTRRRTPRVLPDHSSGQS